MMKYNRLKGFSFFKNRVLQFMIYLQGIEPSIWRRILVPSDYNFWDLHVAIQDSFGWLDYHLHHFEIRSKGKSKTVHIGIPDFDRNAELQEVYPGWEIPVINYFNDLGVQARYIYDYGDDWVHIVKLEGYIFKEKGIKYPLCIAGERACPPEDCGGVDGYYDIIKSLAGSKNADREYPDKWVRKDWHPDWFYKDLVKFDNPHKRWKNSFLKK